jgi:G:T/U-mismatch repair DNA glycosylase
MNNKVIVIGINPSSARKSMSITRLVKWMDHLGVKYFSFSNCIPCTGKYTINDVDFNNVAKYTHGYSKVFALGNFPSQVLKKIGVEHHVLPHPSGLNRKLNDREYTMQQLELARNYLEM